MTEVKSFGEITRKIEERIEKWERAEPFDGMTKVLKGQILIELREILASVNSFEARVRKRLNEITRPEMLSASGSSCAYADDELLKILEGEGREKEEK